MPRVNAAWLDPVSTDPALLVNRAAEIEDLFQRLEEYREAEKHNANLIVTGPRGVGKSIFTRAVLSRFAAAHPTQVV